MSHLVQDRRFVRPAKLKSGSTKSIVLAIFVLLVVAYSVVRVNWFPAITPDSLNYLDHSNDLVGIGFVQQGYRQFAYPAWLALVDTLAVMGSFEPLGLTVVLQRLLLIAAIGIAAVVLRWWSIPVVAVLLSPSAIALSNYILTETIAIPIAVIGSTASVAILQNRARRHPGVWLGAAVVVGVLLPAIRLHYALISLAIAVAILLAGRMRAGFAHRTIIALSIMGLTLGLLVVTLALENRREEGLLSPSIGAERQMFWATWENVAIFHRAEVAGKVPEVYLDGSGSAFLRLMDSSDLSAGEQRAVYASAVDKIYAATGVSLTSERFRSLAGVLAGSRLDDLGDSLRGGAARLAPETINSYIHRYGTVVPVDPDMIGRRYNNGTPPTAVLATALAVPALPSPGLNVMMAYLIPMTLLIGVFLLRFPHARPQAALAVGVILAYSAASFAFMMDNLRFLLPAYLFSITLTLGALREYWLYDREPEHQADAKSSHVSQ